MSRRAITGTLFVVLVATAGWAIYKVEKSRESLSSALASDLPPDTASAAPKRSDSPNAAGEKAAGRNPGGRNSNPDSKNALSAMPDAGPLKPGEILDYTANVSKLSNVATLRLQVAAYRDFLGKPAWHLQAFAHTQNPLRMVFELDDRFDSYSDAAALTSLQYEMHLSERGQKVESVQRMTVTGKEPASPGASQTHVLPGTRDPLGMMQFLRTVDWAKTPEVRCPVYDGHKLYEISARRTGEDSVKVGAGTFAAQKIGIQVFDKGVEMKDAKFTLFLSKDSARLPVLLEAVLPFADARVELTKPH